MRAQRRGDARGAGKTGVHVLDIVVLATTAGFFLVSLAYVRGCDRL